MRKLSSGVALNRETLRRLSPRELQGVVGGDVTTWGCSQCGACPSMMITNCDNCQTQSACGTCCDGGGSTDLE